MLRKLKIGKRLTLAFGLLVLVSVVIGITAMFRLSDMSKNIDILSETRLPAAAYASELNRDFALIRLYSQSLFRAKTEAERDDVFKLIDMWVQKYLVVLEKSAALHTTPEAKAIYDALYKATFTYEALHTPMLKDVKATKIEDLAEMDFKDFDVASKGLSDAIDNVVEYHSKLAQQEAHIAQQDLNRARAEMVVLLITAVILSAIMALFFTRSLVLPMQRAVLISQRIADSDLTEKFDDTEPDEAGEMIRSLAMMQKQLRDTLHEISHSSSQLAATSEELSVVTEQSSRTLHQQSVELDMAATAVTELTTAIEDVARNALETSRNSAEADNGAKEGMKRVEVAVTAIKSLEEDLQHARDGITHLVAGVSNISSVLDVIRAIADQTNLLALNAAIEAARAGESGRGFAVVADEVRALAHRTQESTKEIEKMMLAVQSETQQTVETMNRSSQIASNTSNASAAAGGVFMEIAQALEQINGQNMTVASAAEEQATVAREVDRGLLTIRELSGQTAEGAHETQASSAELARLAEGLNQLITKFKL